MPYMLKKLTGAPIDAVKVQLEADAETHAKDGMYLEHVWQDATDPSVVWFLFRINDLEHAKALTARTHAEARAKDPNVKLPETIFLADV